MLPSFARSRSFAVSLASPRGSARLRIGLGPRQVAQVALENVAQWRRDSHDVVVALLQKVQWPCPKDGRKWDWVYPCRRTGRGPVAEGQPGVAEGEVAGVSAGSQLAGGAAAVAVFGQFIAECSPRHFVQTWTK